jgi:hypothetical protein
MARTLLSVSFALALAHFVQVAPVAAQAGGSGDIELGATSSTGYDSNANATPAASTSYRSSSSLRLGLQLRLDALTMVGLFDDSPGPVGVGRKLLVPMAAPGVRIIDGRLFLGAGLSFFGWSQEQPNGDESSRSGFGLHPLVTFDIVREAAAALSLNAALNIASLGETEQCGGPGPGGMPGGCVDGNDDAFGLGLTVGAGLRGLIRPGLAIGGDFGWGFLNTSSDNDQSYFIHGLYGAILIEASIGL